MMKTHEHEKHSFFLRGREAGLGTLTIIGTRENWVPQKPKWPTYRSRYKGLYTNTYKQGGCWRQRLLRAIFIENKYKNNILSRIVKKFTYEFTLEFPDIWCHPNFWKIITLLLVPMPCVRHVYADSYLIHIRAYFLDTISKTVFSI